MAGDYIKIDRITSTATHSTLMLQFVAQLRSAYETGQRVKAIMNHNHDGNDFAALEALFGIPSGQGQTVFDLVNGAVGSMEGSFQVDDAKELTERVG
jgi:hypothetical protein